MNPTLKWGVFILFCIVSWVAAGSYVFIAGGNECHESGSCALDHVVLVGIFLLIPAQAAIAAFLRQKH